MARKDLAELTSAEFFVRGRAIRLPGEKEGVFLEWGKGGAMGWCLNGPITGDGGKITVPKEVLQELNIHGW